MKGSEKLKRWRLQKIIDEAKDKRTQVLRKDMRERLEHDKNEGKLKDGRDTPGRNDGKFPSWYEVGKNYGLGGEGGGGGGRRRRKKEQKQEAK